MLPVNVDLPESTCPIKTRLAFSFLKIYKLTYLSYGHFLLKSSLRFITGSGVRTVSYSLFYLAYLGMDDCYNFDWDSSGFLF